jgi:hypothetical protein
MCFYQHNNSCTGKRAKKTLQLFYVGWGGYRRGEMLGVIYPMYSLNLIEIFTMNPLLYNEHILIKMEVKKIHA